MRRLVVLPAPFGPRNPVTRPGSTVKDRSLTAVVAPKLLWMWLNSMVVPIGMWSPLAGPQPIAGRAGGANVAGSHSRTPAMTFSYAMLRRL